MAKRLLIVDDEETLTFSLYQSFIHLNKDYEVVTADSGNEALERVAEKSFDLVITDICMPGISGFELMQQLKEKYPETMVIVMTAFGSSDIADKALAEGAIYYIEKPFEIHDVKQKVIELLG